MALMLLPNSKQKWLTTCQTLSLLVLVAIDLSSGSVSWSLATKPAVFGNDIELHCNLDNDTSLNSSIFWTKGDNEKVLVVNGMTVNVTKYSEEQNKAKRTSILTITSLDSGDVNVPYTCMHGFQSFKKVLNMTVENFEYHPSSNNTIFKQDDDHILFLMKFEKVFPLPACKAFIGGKNITQLLKISSVRNHVFYKVGISLKYHHISKGCIHHPFVIDCCVGTKTIKQRFETANDVCLQIEQKAKQGCTDSTDNTFHFIIVCIAIFVVMLVVVSFLAIVLSKYYKTKYRKQTATEIEITNDYEEIESINSDFIQDARTIINSRLERNIPVTGVRDSTRPSDTTINERNDQNYPTQSLSDESLHTSQGQSMANLTTEYENDTFTCYSDDEDQDAYLHPYVGLGPEDYLNPYQPLQLQQNNAQTHAHC